MAAIWKRVLPLAVVAAMILIVWAAQVYFTHAYSLEEGNRARIRATLYSASIQSSLQRHGVVPLLLSRDPILSQALRGGDLSFADERLSNFQSELGSGPIFLLDAEGNVVASSDPEYKGTYGGDRSYFIAAISGEGTEFSISEQEPGQLAFHYSRKFTDLDSFLGVVVVTVDLGALQNGWQTSRARILVSDSEGNVLLASEPEWRNRNLDSIISRESPSALRQFASQALFLDPTDVTFTHFGTKTPYLRVEVPIGFRSWRLLYFDTLEDVRAQVSSILALIIMCMAILLAVGFYMLSRRTSAESRRVLKESDELRLLNRRLSREIAARKVVERNLKQAEQSLEQASKLAALGQMSAAVSHELNQPLAAMKTYLAGARLLLKRNRTEEAISSFQRIDDLINRMGNIMRQLKSYARADRDHDIEVFDLRESVRESVSMMAPQLGKMTVDLTTTLPSERVEVRADPLRVEQIIVNLLRNALDAVRNSDDPAVKVLLVQGEAAVLSIEDNGPGLKDPEKLFEPFYTTKKPGEGLGLGLAISAGFAAEIGGRLVASNAPQGGAIFELILPRHRANAQSDSEHP
ncbi:sensor histidine kinase [Amaricoccus macauensis]|uniref:sensor histidine kinase n=1 Tax=Amaricoccus macauensis TaxID=57001 RepID=UPI003C7A4C29